MTTTNDFEIEYWNGVAGARWVRAQKRFDEMVQPLVRPLLTGDAVRSGMRVLDVGCGCGGSTLDLANLVGPSGSVTGIDVSRPMLGRARARAREGGLDNVRFLEADAQTAALPEVDLVFSRLGVMFFSDPVAGFSNLRRALSPDGDLLAAVWADAPHNPWMTDPPAVVADVMGVAPTHPDGKGPFALSDPNEILQVLEAAGFAERRVEEHRGMVRVGNDASDATDFSLRGIGRVSAAAQDASPSALAAAEVALHEHYTRLASDSGVLADATVLYVRARA